MKFNFETAPQHEKVYSALEILENIDRSKIRPEFNDILGQLIASEKGGTYSNELSNLSSSDKEIKAGAVDYLSRHRDYLRDSADIILRMGFETPEEDTVRAEVVTRIGVISQALEEIGQ